MISDFQAVRENLFPASLGAIEDWEAFPWHRDRTNRIQAHKAHSSQAIAIDVFGTIKMSTDRDRALCSYKQGHSLLGVYPKGLRARSGCRPYAPPFKADSYQWMRNAVLAAAFGRHHKLQAAALAALADHPSFPTARKVKRGLLDASLAHRTVTTCCNLIQFVQYFLQRNTANLEMNPPS